MSNWRWQPTSGEKSQLWSNPENVVSDAWNSLQRLEEDRSIHQIIDVADHVSNGHDLASLVKRSMISSSFVVLKLPKMIYRKQGPDEYLAGLNDGWDMSEEQRELENLLVDHDLNKNDYCVVLPASMTQSSEVSGGETLVDSVERAEKVNEKIRQLEKHVYSLPVGADYATVRRLLRQDDPAESVNSGILMPDIRNLSLQDLTNLRKDYDDGFARMRYSLKRYLDGIATLDNETKFVHLLEEIDHECRVAEDEFNRIKKKHTRSLKGMLVTASLIGVAAAGELFSPGLLGTASAAIGSLTVGDLIKNRISLGDQKEEMKKSDFWIAWKIHQENLRKANK